MKIIINKTQKETFLHDNKLATYSIYVAIHRKKWSLFDEIEIKDYRGGN